MQLRLSTPALLQPLIDAYPAAVFVLLHGSYPFMRELGWLAALYHNVYADFGLPFLMLGANGGREMLRELLELCPTNKLMWSSAGFAYGCL
jgi:predicted TIM-barrel fold metal-dependent hydrolase